MKELTVGEAAARTRWSPRMLRYLERQGSSCRAGHPRATASTGSPSSTGCGRCASCRLAHGVGIDDLAFAARLRREPELRAAVEGWLAAGADSGAWIEWEQQQARAAPRGVTTRI